MSRTLFVPGNIALGFVLFFLAGCSEGGGSTSAPSSGGSTVVATVGGQSVTLDELDEFIMQELLSKQTQSHKPVLLYELREDSLRELLGRTAVEQEAAKEGLTLEEFVERTREGVDPVSDEDIEAYYLENRSRLRHDAGLERLRSGIRSIIEQERAQEAIEQLVRGAQPVVRLEPPRIGVGTEGHTRGPEDAPVTIVEFSDYRCPFCLKAEETMRELRERYPDQLRYVYRHRPRPSDPLAQAAAAAAVCAEEQGRFWEYHDRLFAHQADLTLEQLMSIAVDLGLDGEAFERCRQAPETAQRIALDAAEAGGIGVNATPAFLINGVYLRGARPIEHFERVIQAELSAAERS
jgi:protein-disulfide isomerase